MPSTGRTTAKKVEAPPAHVDQGAILDEATFRAQIAERRRMLDRELAEREPYLAYSTQAFGKFYCPGDFYRPFDEGHDQLFKTLDDPACRRASIAMPRGSGKTTIVRTFVLRHICYWSKFAPYIVIISETETAAQEMTDNLKFALMCEDSDRYRIYEAFGPADRDNAFSRERWIARFLDKQTGAPSAYATCVYPVGVTSQLRGLQFRGRRPSIVILDDVEGDSVKMRSETHRTTVRRIVYGGLFGTLDYGDVNKDDRFDISRIVQICTISHDDCLLRRWKRTARVQVDAGLEPTWTVVDEALATPDLETRFPNFITTKGVRAKWEEYKEAGEEDTFYTEFMNEPSAPGSRAFTRDLFRYYDKPEHELSEDPNYMNFVLIDPARSLEMGSADTAILGVGVDLENSWIYARDVVAEKMSPDTLYREMCDMLIRVRARIVVVEVTGLHGFIYDEKRNSGPLKDALVGRRLSARIIPMNPRTEKHSRIGALLPYFRQGAIWLRRYATSKLENQLLAWPHGALVDVADGFSMIIPAMAQMGIRPPIGSYDQTDMCANVLPKPEAVYPSNWGYVA